LAINGNIIPVQMARITIPLFCNWFARECFLKARRRTVLDLRQLEGEFKLNV
jgi:hypothetical protein|tara:strand:- start:396 stop:551 length:156 start_codon:yes stop_codon:yes gene_type:complete